VSNRLDRIASATCEVSQLCYRNGRGIGGIVETADAHFGVRQRQTAAPHVRFIFRAGGAISSMRIELREAVPRDDEPRLLAACLRVLVRLAASRLAGARILRESGSGEFESE
jgi:hypothetical protein